MKLYTYFRSSAAYRVRIALALKGLAYDPVPVHLLRDGGQQNSAAFRAVNPQGMVPALEDGPALLTQSLAIIEYLEETHPVPALLPPEPLARARVRAFAQAIACDIHPINSLRVLSYLRGPLAQDEAAVTAWIRTWVEAGLTALERLVVPGAPYCFGETPGMADLCLVPQLFNARRFGCDLSGCPSLLEIDARCQGLPAFRQAAPENQPDAE